MKAQISAQSDQGLHCLLTESLDTAKWMSREQRPGWYFGHAQDDLNLHILRMFEDTFSLDSAEVMLEGLLGTCSTFTVVTILTWYVMVLLQYSLGMLWYCT